MQIRGNISLCDLPTELLLNYVYFGGIPVLIRLSATCRYLRRSLWQSSHITSTAILSQHGWNAIEALQYLVNRTTNYFKFKKGHPLGGEFEADIVRTLLGNRRFKGDPINEILFQAVSNKDLVIATLLVEAGADVDFVKNKMPLIRLACRLVKRVDDPGLNVARMLLARGGTVNHLGNLKGFWDGVWQNHIVKVQFLVDAGIDVNAVDIGDPLEPTALIQACRRDFMELATILLDAGADPNYGPGFPLCYVARNGNRELFDLLFSRGADIKIIPPHDHYNKGPVPELCGSRSTGATEEFLKFLLDSGCPYDGEEGDRALFRAAIYNKTGHLRLLLERGAEAGHRTLLGLKGACEEGHSEVVEMLLEAGVRLGPLTFWNNSVYEGLLNIGRDDLVVRVKKTVEAIQ